MPIVNSHADVVTDLRELAEACDRSPEVKEEIAKEQQAVVDSLSEIQTLKARQIELIGLKQETTQQLKNAVTRGKINAQKLRAVLKGKFGLQSERLVQFKVAPVRRRGRKNLERKPTDGELAGDQPATPPSKPAA